MYRTNILIYIQQDATLHSLFYLETALHVSGGTITHHQERKQLYLQHLVFVTPLLLSAAIVEEFELISVRCGWRIRRANNCVYSIWYLSHCYCYRLLSWKRWNWFECAVGGLCYRAMRYFLSFYVTQCIKLRCHEIFLVFLCYPVHKATVPWDISCLSMLPGS